MRKQFTAHVMKLLAQDLKTVLLLGDIGVHAFREAFEKYPGRVFNVGILEQAMVGVAAGWALRGYLPIVHTIAPFLVERAYEQLKIDFGYQKLPGIFASVGGSYDYASLGCTHHCPADVSLVSNIPGFNVLVPGHPDEIGPLLTVTEGQAVYLRLSEHSNPFARPPGFGNLTTRPGSSHPIIIAVGPTLDLVFKAAKDLQVDIYYTNVVNDAVLDLRSCSPGQPFIVVENYYSSRMATTIASRFFPTPVAVTTFGVPRNFIHEYGTKKEVDHNIGFTPENLRQVIEKCQPR